MCVPPTLHVPYKVVVCSTESRIARGRWHDFVQESEGCGSDAPLREAGQALAAAATFLNASRAAGGCAVVCGERLPARPSAAGLSPVRWSYDYNFKPPITRRDCANVW